MVVKMTIRARSVADDKHNIRDPLTSVNDCRVFTNTLLKKKLASYFLTAGGLKGHALQLEQQLVRLSKVEDKDQAIVVEATASLGIN